MTASRDPRRPLRGGQNARAETTSEGDGKPLLERIRALLGRRRESVERTRDRARGEQAAIAREKAAARRQKAAGSTSRADRTRTERSAGARRGRSRARPAAKTAAARIAAFGERSSKVLLAAAAPVIAATVTAASLGRRALAWLEAALTPLRAVVAVTGIAAVLLGVSQFVDYRGVAVGVDDYAAYGDVEPVASAPQVDRRPAGEPHSYLLVPVAVLALALLVASVRGRWQLGRVISLLGLGVIAVSMLVDAPAGLDEDVQAIAYASVEAQLLEGFYVQLVSGAVLVAAGLLVSRYARPARRGRVPTSRRGAAVGRLGARTA